MLLVSYSERELFPLLSGAVWSPLPEKYGVDVLTGSRYGLVGWQRKAYPEDFLASLGDGRLTRELSLMAVLAIPVLVIEGHPQFTSEGHLIQEYASRWTKRQLRNLLRSCSYTSGVRVEQTESVADTRDAILEFVAWLGEGFHRSLLTRPKGVMLDTWGQRQSVLKFFYQGMGGVGTELAEKLAARFPTPADLCAATQEELMSVPLIGKKRAEAIYGFLHRRQTALSLHPEIRRRDDRR